MLAQQKYYLNMKRPKKYVCFLHHIHTYETKQAS